jgi:predicted GNAT family N-acyltransferase
MREIRVVPHDSPEYWQAIELRRRILRHPLGLDFTAEDLAKEVNETHIVAIDEGKVIGCLVMVPQNCSVVKMRQVAVEPSLQGQGIGADMVRASEEWARDARYSQIELNARDTAVKFYRGLQYTIVGEPFEEVTIPHSKMVKDL